MDEFAKCRLVLGEQGVTPLALKFDDVVRITTLLYRRGDSAEKQAVLAALPTLDRATGARPAVGDALLPIVRDALRTNDTRLVECALGAYAAAHLDDAAWRQGVVKGIFMGIPIDAVADLGPGEGDAAQRDRREEGVQFRVGVPARHHPNRILKIVGGGQVEGDATQAGKVLR